MSVQIISVKSFGARLAGTVIFGFLLAQAPPLAWANPGGVESEQKISQILGTFSGVLSDEDHFGWSITSVGDLDGDGISDLAVGAPDDDDGVGLELGAVRASVRGPSLSKGRQEATGDFGDHGPRTSADRTAGHRESLTETMSWLFCSYGRISPRFLGGIALVFLLFFIETAALPNPGEIEKEQKISDILGGFSGTLDTLDYLGASVTSVGDLDGDGVSDLAVGARLDDDGGPNRGAVWILFLKADGTVKAEQKISDTEGTFIGKGDFFGTSVAAIGDIDGDGVVDLAVGALYDDTTGASDGAVWVLFLGANGTVKAHRKITPDLPGAPENPSEKLGRSVAPLGDLDGDGVPDLIAGPGAEPFSMRLLPGGPFSSAPKFAF